MPKVILSVDVKDEEFKRFQHLFDQYKEALEETPRVWEKAAFEIGNSEKKMAGVGAWLTRNNSHLDKMIDGHRRLSSILKEEDTISARIARSALSLVNPITWVRTAASAVKTIAWTTLGLGLGSFGGLWGLDNLALGAGQRRYAAMGLGTSTGRMQAADIFLGKFFNPQAVMSNIAGAQADPSQWSSFFTMGIRDFQKKDPVALAKEVAERARELYIKGHGNAQYLEAMGVTNFMSIPDARRLGSMSSEELQDTFKKLEEAIKKLEVPDDTNKAWQELSLTLKEVRGILDNTFIKILGPLSKPLGELSVAFSSMLQGLLTHERVAQWIGDLEKGMENLSEYISSGQFHDKFESFITNVFRIGTMLGSFADWMWRNLGIGPTPPGTEVPGGTYSVGGRRFDDAGVPLPPPIPSTPEDQADYKKNLDAWRQINQGMGPFFLPPGQTNLPTHPGDAPGSGANRPGGAAAAWGEKAKRGLGSFWDWAIRLDGGWRDRSGHYREFDWDSMKNDTGLIWDFLGFEYSEQQKNGFPLRRGLISPDQDELEHQYGLQHGLLDALWDLESSRSMKGDKHLTKHGWVMGPFQMLKSTGGQYDLHSDEDFMSYAKESVAASKYLAHLEDMFNHDVFKVAAAYNSGEGTVRNAEAAASAAKDPNSWIKYLPGETQEYLHRLVKHGFDPAKRGGEYGIPVTVNIRVYNQTGAQVAVQANAASAVL